MPLGVEPGACVLRTSDGGLLTLATQPQIRERPERVGEGPERPEEHEEEGDQDKRGQCQDGDRRRGKVGGEQGDRGDGNDDREHQPYDDQHDRRADGDAELDQPGQQGRP